MDQLFTIVYLSNATEALSSEELKDILTVSRANNSKMGVSGVLIYCDGNILQVLEGLEENVLKVYDKIKTDPRHTDLIILQQRGISGRSFEDWSMGFRASSKAEFEQIEGYLNLRKQVENNGNDSLDQVKTLLVDFINNNR
ncbi:BLUF domain-containing protein [Pedobacter sp. SYSU D00535]|uniref:BLUF domain-containing protein n=1 Tax=Pedobacter sp. SYSU D00535 TaxID=2810308 RepID=UPI001A95D244|nr:BLUF domain-containing protein [Pedobacter sp. SYSU D00535]